MSCPERGARRHERWINRGDIPSFKKCLRIIDDGHIGQNEFIRNAASCIERVRSGKGYPERTWWTTIPDYLGSPIFNLFENPEMRLEDSKI